MITPRDIRPEKSLYAIGAKVIMVLKNHSTDSVHLDDLYKSFCAQNTTDKITFSYFSYAIDWLFLLNLVKIGDRPSEIKKCF